MKKLLLIGMVICMWACRTGKPTQINSSTATNTSTTTNKKEITKDSAIAVNADSSLYKALLECDSNGNVLMRQVLAYKRGLHVQPPTLQLQNNQLTAKCLVDSFAIYMKYAYHFKSVQQLKDTTNTTTITLPPVVTNVLTWWQKLLIKLGFVSTTILLLIGAFKIYGWKIKNTLKIRA
jgi:hypothetical protein